MVIFWADSVELGTTGKGKSPCLGPKAYEKVWYAQKQKMFGVAGAESSLHLGNSAVSVYLLHFRIFSGVPFLPF